MKYEATLLKWIKWGVILTIFMPLVLGPFGITLSNWPKAVFFRILVEIIFILYLLLVYINQKYLPGFSFLIWANIIFFGILFLSALLGVNFYRSFFGDLYRAEGLVLHLHFLVFLIIVVAVFSKINDWTKFLKITVIVGALSSFAGILQKIGTLPFYKSNPFSFYGVALPHRISGTWTNPDFFAPYIVLNIFLVFYLYTLEKNKRWKNILIFISALNILSLILSETRASWIGFGAGVIFFFAVQLSRLSFFSLKAKKAVLAGFLFLSIAGLFFTLNQEGFFLSENRLIKKVSTLFDVNSILYSGRLAGWKIAISAWRDRPILGWGPESYSFLFDKYFREEYLDYIPESIFFDRPHNKVLEIMATNGTIGILAYIGLFSAIFYCLIKNYRKNPAGNLFLMALFISYFVQNLIIYSLNLKPTIACMDFVKGVYNLEAKDYEKTISYFYKGVGRATLLNNDFKKEFIERTLLLLNNNTLPQGLSERMIKILSGLKASVEKSLEIPDRRQITYYKMLAIINEKEYLISGDENNLKEMERILNEAVNFNKEKAAPYQMLGVLRIYQKNFQESDYFFQKYFDLSGRDRISIWKQMGVVYSRADEKDKAAENFKKYLIGELTVIRVNKTYSRQDLQRIFSFSADLIKFHIENFNDREEPKEILVRLIDAFPEYENWINANIGILI